MTGNMTDNMEIDSNISPNSVTMNELMSIDKKLAQVQNNYSNVKRDNSIPTDFHTALETVEPVRNIFGGINQVLYSNGAYVPQWNDEAAQCLENVNEVAGAVMKILNNASTSADRSIYARAVRVPGSENVVELMLQMMGSAQSLSATNTHFTKPLERQVKELQEKMMKLQKLSPSAQASESDNKFLNSGSGNLFTNMNGFQPNNTSRGRQYIGTEMHFGKE